MGWPGGADQLLTMERFSRSGSKHGRPPSGGVAEMARQEGRDDLLMHQRNARPAGR